MDRMMPVWILGLLALLAARGQAADEPDPLMHLTPPTGATPTVESGVTPEKYLRCKKCERPGGPCRGGLWDCLTSRPPRTSVKCASHQCEECCHPPLYAFFLHHCRNCARDEGPGMEIRFSYTDLLDQCGDCGCHHGSG